MTQTTSWTNINDELPPRCFPVLWRRRSDDGFAHYPFTASLDNDGQGVVSLDGSYTYLYEPGDKWYWMYFPELPELS